MTHLTDLQCSMYVDGALTSEESSVLDDHVAGCTTCQARLSVFREDKGFITIAMTNEFEVVPQLELPKFKKPVGLREFAVANLLTGLLFWLAQFSSKAIFGEIVVDGFSWLTSIFVPDVYDLALTTTLYFTNEGTVMIEAYSGFIVAAILAVAATWLLLYVVKSKQALSFCLLTVVLGSGLALPQEASAIEHRRGSVVIPSGEIVNDTLLFTGESIVVDGIVTGDLVVFSKRVVVTGKVNGNLIAFAESLSISGEVSGTTINAGKSVELTDANLGGDFWGAGESIQISRETRIVGNAVLAADQASVQGEVGKDLTTAAETVELRGKVGEDMVAYGSSIKLLGDAGVVGDLTIHSEGEDSLSRSSESTVGGSIQFEHHDSDGRSKNRYATFQFYGFQVLKLAAAFIIGYGLFMLFPTVRSVSLDGGVTGFVTAGVGLVTLVSLPVILVLVAITVVGLPVTFFGFATWFLGLYLAKIMVAWLIGSRLFSDSDGERGVALPLITGLAIVSVAINIPFIGGVISFVMTIVGIGMLVQWLMANYSRDAAIVR
jgi:cytoskeletal protein CcmA (bactofilin family)